MGCNQHLLNVKIVTHKTKTNDFYQIEE